MPRKMLTETLNVSMFVSSFLNFVYLGILHFLRRSAYRALKKELSRWDEYQENTSRER